MAKMTVFFLSVLISAVISAAVASNYDDLAGHQIWKLDGQESALPFQLRSESLLDILGHSESSTQVKVASQHVQKVQEIFEKEGVAYQVLVNDLAAHLEAENQKEEARRDLSRDTRACTQTSCPQPLNTQYMRFNEMTWYLQDLNRTYTSKVNVKSIGKSYENRNMWLVNIKSTNASAKSVWIEGGLHAREWISPAVALGLIDKLVNDANATKNYNFFIAPMANPDGYEYSWTNNRYWRKNRRKNGGACDGVDLNRNWDYKYGVGASSNTCDETYKGVSAFSEPETRALRDAMTAEKSRLLLVLALHSYGQNLLYPWGWSSTVAAPNKAELIAAGNVFANGVLASSGKKYSVVNSAGGLYLASGATDDWALGVLNTKYVYTLELRDTGAGGFVLGTDQIQPTVNEVWSGLKALLARMK